MQKFTVTYSDNRASKTIEELDINYALLNVVDSEDFKTDVFSNDENNDGEIEVDGYGIVIRNEQGNEIPFSINLKEQSAYGELDGISFEIKLIQ